MPLCSMESSEKRAPVYGREAWKAPRRFRLAEPGSSLKPALQPSRANPHKQNTAEFYCGWLGETNRMGPSHV